MTRMTTAELRGYHQICADNGLMLVIACDQRGSLRTLMSSDPAVQATITMDRLGDTKADVTTHLASAASAILLDPLAAVPAIVDAGILPRDIGLIIGLDDSGYGTSPEGYRLSKLVPGISARRVRDLGGTAGKIMVYLRSDVPAANVHNIDILKHCIADFAAENLLLVVEFLTYALPGESDADYRAKVADLAVGGSRICLELGAKLLKIPFPGSAEAARRITELCGEVPWAVLSAGVDHATFVGQVEICMQAGASGVIAGRSLWKDCVSLDRDATRQRLSGVAIPRLDDLKRILDAHTRPLASNREQTP
jgi:tagatose-1,6-bisphosphate aldolase